MDGILCDLKRHLTASTIIFFLSKLKFYEGRGNFYDLIISYITNRYQRVSLLNIDFGHISYSSWDINKHGVLQCSILGPLLFLCNINDLPQVLKIMLN